MFVIQTEKPKQRYIIQDKCRYTKRESSNACLTIWISVMLITFIILTNSFCYENIDILQCLGKIMSHKKTAFCLCRLHLVARFHHFRFNSPALTRLLNWTSSQISLSHRPPQCRFSTNYRWCDPDEWNIGLGDMAENCITISVFHIGRYR